MRKKAERLIVPTEERFRRDLVYINNPVLVEGLALAPVIAAAVTLRNAVILSAALLLLLTPTRFIGNLLVGVIPQRLRAMTYALTASLLYIPARMLLGQVFGIRLANLGLYLPMIVVDSILISRAEIPQREGIPESLRNGIFTALGFALAVTVTGAARELLGEGRLWGAQLLPKAVFPAAVSRAGGFIITAVLAALLQYLISVTKRRAYRGARERE